MTDTLTKEQILKDAFGYSSFRGKQAEAIDSVMAGRDVLYLAPTGLGKSATFQIPALMLDGLTVVVSPLIALMKDQTDNLDSKGIPATFVNSSLGQSDYNERLDMICAGEFKMLYVAPERFSNERFMEAMKAVKVSLFAVDEAHCFTGETMVSTPRGERRIDSIMVGDEVMSRDGVRRVTSTYLHRGHDIWKLRVNGRDIYCDGGQKIFVNNIGFVDVGMVLCGQEVVIHESTADEDTSGGVRSLWHQTRDARQKEQTAEQILLNKMSACGFRDGEAHCAGYKDVPHLWEGFSNQARIPNHLLFQVLRSNKRKQTHIILKDDEQQSYGQSGCERGCIQEGEGHRQTQGSSRREWSRTNESRSDSGGSWRLQNKPHSRDWTQREGWWASSALQAGLGVAITDGGSRGGRRVSQLGEGAGSRPSQGRIFATARVESISRVERGSILGCGERLGENPAGVRLYDIEVEGSHNFFANGVLAHNCVSQWGHDFRPDYLKLGKAIKAFGRPTIIAVTATATPHVRQDIIKQLDLQNVNLLVSGFERPNLTFSVESVSGKETKLWRVQQEISKHKTGIVYCATRKNVELVSQTLKSRGVNCLAYHGGLKEEDRTDIQNQFMQGKAPVAVATNAFGMGIDRADLRFVVHYDIPGSVEALYQEAGRAGRDGAPSSCHLLYDTGSVATQKFFIEGQNPTRDVVQRVYETVQQLCRSGSINMPVDDIAGCVRDVRNGLAVGGALKLLEKHRAIRRWYEKGSRAYHTALTVPNVRFESFKIDFGPLDAKRIRDYMRLNEVVSYAENYRQCRQGFILDYFGEDFRKCGRCDICKGRA